MQLSEKAKSVLAKARATYGSKNQISVAIEELNELACVLCKFIRYDHEEDAIDALYEKVVDEMADVLVVTDHIKAIFGLADRTIEARAEAKVARVHNWLEKSDSMEQTTVDREVPDPTEKAFCDSVAQPNCKNCASCANKDDRATCEQCNGRSNYVYRCW